MPPHCGRPGYQARPARVEQRGHLPLILGHRPGGGQVDARQQPLPGTRRRDPMMQGTRGHAAREHLGAGDDAVLLLQDAVQARLVEWGLTWHAHSLSSPTDKVTPPASLPRQPPDSRWAPAYLKTYAGAHRAVGERGRDAGVRLVGRDGGVAQGLGVMEPNWAAGWGVRAAVGVTIRRCRRPVMNARP